MTKRVASAVFMTGTLVACAQIVDAGFDEVSLDRPNAPVEAGLDSAPGVGDSTASGGSAGAPDSIVESDSGGATNTAPEARDDTLVVVEGTRKRAWLPSFDGDGDARQHRLVGPAALGGVVIIDPATGEFEYSSELGKYGADSFTYQVSDGKVDSSAAGTIRVTVVARGPLRAEPGPGGEIPTPLALLSGWALDIEGDTAAVGVREDHLSLIYVVRRDAGGSWKLSQKIDEGLNSARLYGYDVALSGDWMAVSAWKTMPAGLPGAVYFYKRPSSEAAFEFKQRIDADSTVDDGFGWQIALDGDLAVIGAPIDLAHPYGDGGFGRRAIGAVHVYRRQSDDTWRQENKISAPRAEQEENFGWSVGIADGAVVTTAFALGASAYRGAAVYVFGPGDVAWTMESRFDADPVPPRGSFGNTVAAHDGKILVPCPLLPDGVYAYERGPSGWQARGLVRLPVGEAIIDAFGTSVALHDETAIITMSPGSQSGAAFVYHYVGSDWQYAQRKLIGMASGRDGFGYSAAFDGTTAVITASDETSSLGAIYFFGIEPPRND